MYRVNIEEISESDYHAGTYMPPKFWINFKEYAESLVDWGEVSKLYPYGAPQDPIFPMMKGLLRGLGADIIVEGSYTLLFESAEDFLVFKLKWS